ncbi:MAG: hypothetical protein PVH19_04465 [Planctomycetia bacterium]|jgi:hypothetical protein
MIAQNLVEEVRRLLDTGKYSQREIARRTQVSRGTVSAIASGKRTNRVPVPKVQPWELEGPIKRCPTCGGLVHTPCRLCETRREIAADKNAFKENNDPFPEITKKGSWDLELEGEDRDRYEEVRRRRILQGETDEKPVSDLVYEEPDEWDAVTERSFEDYLDCLV